MFGSVWNSCWVDRRLFQQNSQQSHPVLSSVTRPKAKILSAYRWIAEIISPSCLVFIKCVVGVRTVATRRQNMLCTCATSTWQLLAVKQRIPTRSNVDLSSWLMYFLSGSRANRLRIENSKSTAWPEASTGPGRLLDRSRDIMSQISGDVGLRAPVRGGRVPDPAAAYFRRLYCRPRHTLTSAADRGAMWGPRKRAATAMKQRVASIGAWSSLKARSHASVAQLAPNEHILAVTQDAIVLST